MASDTDEHTVEHDVFARGEVIMKVGIVGAGSVGTACIFALALRGSARETAQEITSAAFGARSWLQRIAERGYSARLCLMPRACYRKHD